MLKHKYWLVFGLIVAIGIGLRLRNWNYGFTDAHPMRQTDAECVAYFLYTGEADLLHPKSCLMRPVVNTQGYFFLEFPVYEGIIALGYKIFGVSIGVVRVINLILYVLAAWGIYGFVKKILDEKNGLWTTFLFSTAPASIFFVGHALHPDVFALAMMAVSLMIMMKPLGALHLPPLEKGTIIFSGLMLGLSVATRPFGLIVLPVYFWALWKNKARWWKYLLVTILSVSFYGLWRGWIEMVGVSADWENWVLAGREKLFDFDTLFRRLIWINVSGEVIGRAISALFGLGVILAVIKKEKKLIPIGLWLLLVPIYWFLVPNGNLTHQYYADVFIFPIAILAGYGLNWLWSKNKLIGFLVIGLVIYNGYRTSDYFFEDKVPEIKLKIAHEIEDNIPIDGKILYLVKSDSVPISLAHRQGWMLGEWPTDVAPHIWSVMEMRNYQIDYFVEPKGSWDMRREDMIIVEENFPLYKETENLRILKWEKK